MQSTKKVLLTREKDCLLQISVSHVLYFVDLRRNLLRGNHLSQGQRPSPTISSVTYVKLPYRSLGFPLEGFTAFHPACFHTGFVTVALFRDTSA